MQAMEGVSLCYELVRGVVVNSVVVVEEKGVRWYGGVGVGDFTKSAESKRFLLLSGSQALRIGQFHRPRYTTAVFPDSRRSFQSIVALLPDMVSVWV